MVRLPLAPLTLVVLLAASTYGSNPMYDRSGCGCLRNTVAAKLTSPELVKLRRYVQQIGVKHYQVLSDYALQAVFRFNLMNNYQDVVPSSRVGVLQVLQESLSTLNDKVVPSAKYCGQIAGYLKESVPQLASGGINIDLRALVASTSVILHQRGVKVNLDQLNILLKTGLMGYLQSTAYQVRETWTIGSECRSLRPFAFIHRGNREQTSNDAKRELARRFRRERNILFLKGQQSV